MDPQPPSSGNPAYSSHFTPAAQPAPPKSRRKLVGLLAALLVVLVAVGAAAAFIFLRGANDVLISEVPSDSAVYVTAYLDPSAGQKVNVNNLLGKFPSTSSQTQRDDSVNKALDSMLSTSGVSHDQVRSWLGTQVAVVVSSSAVKSLGGGNQGGTNGLGTSAPPSGIAVLINEKDDNAASSTLATLKSKASATDWTTESTGGVTVTFSTTSNVAYALFNHTVVVATDHGEADQIINTQQGKNPSLGADSAYKSTLAQLPSDNLGIAYVNIADLRNGLAGATGISASSIAAYNAYNTAAVSVTAQSDGVQVDAVTTYDSSKLTGQQKALVQQGTHPNSIINYTPQNAFAFLAFGQLGDILSGIDTSLQALAAGNGGQDPLQALGLTPSGPIVSHLTGDFGVFLAPDSNTSGGTGGALLVATNDEAAMQSYLDSLPSALGCQTPDGSPCATTTTTYNGTTVTMLTSPISGLQPAWAVYKGMGIVGTSQTAVEAAIDATSKGNATSSSTYKSVSAHVIGSPFMYVDTHAVAQAVRAAMPPDVQSSYDKNVAPWLNHIGAVVVSGTSNTSQATSRIFVQIS